MPDISLNFLNSYYTKVVKHADLRKTFILCYSRKITIFHAFLIEWEKMTMRK